MILLLSLLCRSTFAISPLFVPFHSVCLLHFLVCALARLLSVYFFSEYCVYRQFNFWLLDAICRTFLMLSFPLLTLSYFLLSVCSHSFQQCEHIFQSINFITEFHPMPSTERRMEQILRIKL